MHETAAPVFDRGIQQKFAARGIHSVVGGSAVLASLGLVEEVQD